MDRITLTLSDPVQAHKALTQTIWPLAKANLIAGRRMTIDVKPETRSLQANARMWAMLADISRQVNWHGRKLTSEEWKHVFTAAFAVVRGRHLLLLGWMLRFCGLLRW